jgi:hypothetical protein
VHETPPREVRDNLTGWFPKDCEAHAVAGRLGAPCRRVDGRARDPGQCVDQLAGDAKDVLTGSGSFDLERTLRPRRAGEITLDAQDYGAEGEIAHGARRRFGLALSTLAGGAGKALREIGPCVAKGAVGQQCLFSYDLDGLERRRLIGLSVALFGLIVSHGISASG